MTKNVGHIELRAASAFGVAEEHEIEAVRSEGGPLVVEAFDLSLARAVRLHHAIQNEPALMRVKAMRSPRGNQTGVE